MRTHAHTGTIGKLLLVAVLPMLSNGNFRLLAAESGPPSQPAPSPADYAVYKDEVGMVCLQATKTGQVVEQGKEASAIIQKALDLLPSSGGKVYIGGGDYQLDKTIVIHDKHGVHLEGAARGMHGPGNGGTVLWSDKPINLLEIFGNQCRWGITVSNLLLHGSGKDNGKAGIWVHGTTDVMTFYNVGANNCGIGFHIQGGRGADNTTGIMDAAQIYFCDPQDNGIGMLVERANYMKVVGGEFSDCLEEGIRLSSVKRHEVQGVKIIGVTAIRCGGAGILIGKNCSDITVTGGADVAGTRKGSGIVVSAEGEAAEFGPTNVILSNIHAYSNDVDGITLDRARHVIVSSSICSGHEHGWIASASQKAGIRIKSGTEDVVVTGNIAYGNAEQGIVDETGQARIVGNSEVASPSSTQKDQP